MMRKDIDELLQTALTPTDEPDGKLNDRILRIVKEREKMTGKTKSYRRRIPAATIAAACILVLCSGTALAVYKYLSPTEVAEEVENDALHKAFLSEDAILVNESQESGGYRVTLLGSVAGRNISDFMVQNDRGEVEDNKIYTVVAIEHADGTPMPDTSSDEYGKQSFYASHYIRGLDPGQYSLMSMGGGYTEFVKEGIQYRLLEMDNIEMFADKGIYVGVSSGTFYEADAYKYDENTGEMSRNVSYAGVNALFTLPVDAEKADPVAAEAYLKELEDSWNDPGEPVEKDVTDLAVDEFMEMLTPENIDEYAEPIESTRQTCSVDEYGNAMYSYELTDDEGAAAGSGGASVESLFPDGKAGMCRKFDYGYSELGLADLLIDVYILNEDGTITFVLYRPKQ
ncbi:MAG: DUF4179 domain-containing protein [Lachnospiraceae bacterium]|nr:DUF4179 domain-containing protein [Lachnospiraceae bacterium]